MEGLTWYGSETVPPTIFVGDNSWFNSWIIYGNSCSYKVNVITKYGVMEGLAWYGSETVPPTIFMWDNSWGIRG